MRECDGEGSVEGVAGSGGIDGLYGESRLMVSVLAIPVQRAAVTELEDNRLGAKCEQGCGEFPGVLNGDALGWSAEKGKSFCFVGREDVHLFQ